MDRDSQTGESYKCFKAPPCLVSSDMGLGVDNGHGLKGREVIGVSWVDRSMVLWVSKTFDLCGQVSLREDPLGRGKNYRFIQKLDRHICRQHVDEYFIHWSKTDCWGGSGGSGCWGDICGT